MASVPAPAPDRALAPRVAALVILTALAAASRLLPHPPNVSTVGALALFAGAAFPVTWAALVVPLAALALSDAVLGFHAVVPAVYAAFAINVALGTWLRGRRRPGPIALCTLIGAVQFFVTTNFACWLLYYPGTWDGLVGCYVAALPFFRNTLLGDFASAAALFGALALIEARVPAVREANDRADAWSW